MKNQVKNPQKQLGDSQGWPLRISDYDPERTLVSEPLRRILAEKRKCRELSDGIRASD